MDQEEFNIFEEELNERCGEIYVTVKGNMIFICTLCDIRTKGFDSYTEHISSEHYTLENVKEVITADQEDAFEENDFEENQMLQIKSKFSKVFNMVTTVDVDDDALEVLDEIDVKIKEEEIEMMETEGESDFESKSRQRDDILSLIQTEIKGDDEGNITEAEKASDVETHDQAEQMNDVASSQITRTKKLAIKKNSIGFGEELVENRFGLHFDTQDQADQMDEVASLQKTRTKKLAVKKLSIGIGEELVKNRFKPVEKVEGKEKLDIKERRKLPPDSAERKHKCSECGLGFLTRNNLKSHLRRHSDKKEHACPHCPKRFFWNTELAAHIRRHNNERPYLCTFCGKSFVTSSTLTMHTKRHLNIRNKVCNICDRTFYDNRLLREHMLTHNGERSFQCSVCDAKFARRKALVCHEKLHENKREYNCDFCPAKFNQGPGLYSHLRSKHQLDKTAISNYRAVITTLVPQE